MRSFIISFLFIISSRMIGDIEFKSNSNSKGIQNIQTKSEEELSKLTKQYAKGCHKIFHKPGYMNVKGDAPYDFTCDGSHRCPSCQDPWRALCQQYTRRKDEIQRMKNKQKTSLKLTQIRKKYFKSQPQCSCSNEKICDKCLQKLQQDVTKYQKGCGAEWSEEFGGMAAGPAYVTCRDNYFLCQKCKEELAFIAKLEKEHPEAKIKHIPQIEKDFWCDSSKPYYREFL